MMMEGLPCSGVLRLFAILALLVVENEAHVTLTYPPARMYPLDFLDVIRTPAPCGMAKGLGPITDFKANEEIKLTWHVAYPHRGSFSINLLDDNEQLIYEFTNGFVQTDDPTMLSYNILIPDITCMNCSIQVMREAGEWGTTCNNGKYDFYTCADVNIRQNDEGRSNCSYHGTYSNGECTCNHPWVGNKCQYKEECLEDADCLNGGKCEMGVSTTYPKNHCYCSAGWFGRSCEKRSTVTAITSNDDDYIPTAMAANGDFRMYHRIIQSIGEIEIMLHVKTDSWVGVGWRPSGYRSGCQHFPVLPPFLNYDGSADGESEGEEEGASEEGASEEGASEEGASEEGDSEEHYYEMMTYWCPTGDCDSNMISWRHKDEMHIEFSIALEFAPDLMSNWIAVGISKTAAMTYSDAIVIYASPTADDIVISDRYIGGSETIPAVDASQDVSLANHNKTGDITHISFTRMYNTGDASDVTIDADHLHVLYAYGAMTGGSLSKFTARFSSPAYCLTEACVADMEAAEEESATEESATEESATEESATEESATEESATEESATEESATEESATEESAAYVGEWCPNNDCDIIKISWSFDETMVTFYVTAAVDTDYTTTWLGLGITEVAGMTYSDTIVMYGDGSGSPMISDRYINDRKTAPTTDSQQDVTLVEGSIVGNIFNATFYRMYDTNDEDDVAITESPMFLLFAYGSMSGTTLNYHGYRYLTPAAMCISHACVADMEAAEEESATEESVTEESATEESATEESATEESATEESATEESATEESAVYVGEWCPNNDCDIIKISWSFDETMVTFYVTAAVVTDYTTTWMALGITEVAGMTYSDTIVMYGDGSGSPMISDRYINDRKTAPTTDSQQDVTLVEGSIVGNIFNATFYRMYDTNDEDDVAITENPMFLLFAYGSMSGTTLNYHGYRYLTPAAMCISHACAEQEMADAEEAAHEEGASEEGATDEEDAANEEDAEHEEDAANEEDAAHEEDAANEEDAAHEEDAANEEDAAHEEDAANEEDAAHEEDAADEEGASEEGGAEGEGGGSCGRLPTGSSPTTGAAIHAMDCVDLVIGSAKGSYSRIGDYYTRDRSTPLFDSEYGGSDSLTAAIAEENGGYTKIIFRRKLQVPTDDRSDHSIVDDAMHVVWARGQVAGQVHHSPNSGLEHAASNPSIPNYYLPDELKYHGNDGAATSYGHRGFFTTNFFEDPRGMDTGSSCDGSYTSPTDAYTAIWNFNSETGIITFTISATLSASQQQWLAIGLNSQAQMSGDDADAYLAWVDAEGVAAVSDRHMPGRTQPTTDPTQNVDSVTGDVADGVTTVTFSRALNTGDADNDFIFDGTACAYFLFAWGGSVGADGSLGQHSNREISSRQYCFTSCDMPATTAGAVTITRVVTFSFKINLSWIEAYANRQSSEYRDLAGRLDTLLKAVLMEIAGYKQFEITELRQGSVEVEGDVELQQTGDTVESIETQMEEDVEKAVGDMVLEENRDGFTFLTGYGVVVGDAQTVRANPTDVMVDDDEDPIGTIGYVIIGIAVVGVLFLVLLAVGTYTKRHLAKAHSKASSHENLYQDSYGRTHSTSMGKSGTGSLNSAYAHPENYGQAVYIEDYPRQNKKGYAVNPNQQYMYEDIPRMSPTMPCRSNLQDQQTTGRHHQAAQMLCIMYNISLPDIKNIPPVIHRRIPTAIFYNQSEMLSSEMWVSDDEFYDTNTTQKSQAYIED